MSGQFPTSPVARNAVIRSQQTTIVSITTSGRKQARQIDGQRFAITLQFPNMTRAEFAPIQAFHNEAKITIRNLYSSTTNSKKCFRCLQVQY
jgi:hypothetical protein